jgi:hypothetical protein
MRGRVYERRSDLSPDGSLFIYFARRSAGPAPAGEQRDSWVAISRPPWFTALALWFIGSTYCVGGFFPDERSVWLGAMSSPPDQGALSRWLRLDTSQERYVDRTLNWPERTVYLNRLRRDGWEPVAAADPETWRHRSPDHALTLIMTWRSQADFTVYGGPHVVEYGVHQTSDAEVVALGRATWADWDQRGRLIVAQEGRLLHWQPPGTMVEIADFNDQSPEPMPSPVAARRWPSRPRTR